MEFGVYLLINRNFKMTKGKVKWYNEIKGFGFIESEKGDDIFVHRSGLKSPFGGLHENQEVEFQVEQGEKGPFATNVR